MSFTPALYDPSNELIDSIIGVIQTGPGYGVTSTWIDKAPAEHWLLPEGTRIYRSDDEGEIEETPALVIGKAGDSVPRFEHTPALWDVPLIIECIWPAEIPDQSRKSCARALQCALTEGIKEGSNTIKTETYLSNSLVKVHYISKLSAQEEKREGGHPALVLLINVFCSGIAQ